MRGLERDQTGPLHTVGSAMRDMARRLTRAGIAEAGGDVRRLMAGVLGVPGAELLRTPERALTAAELELLRAYVARRLQHEPVSRILGARDFYGRTFAISPATLDPRPDSETLITTALDIVREEAWLAQPLRILDVGTGSGCLLLTMLCELPEAAGLGTDVSEAALAVASRNARRLGLERAAWQRADALESVAGPFHILIANLPYVRTTEISQLPPEVRHFDPLTALDGGPDGLAVYRRLVRRLPDVVPAGWIVLEVGHDQADAVVAMLTSEVPGMDGARVRIRHDVAGKRRCVAARTLA